VNLKILLEQKTFLETANLDRFDFIEKASQSLQGKLSGIVKLLEFDKKSSNKHLIAAIKYFKENENLKKDFSSFSDNGENVVQIHIKNSNEKKMIEFSELEEIISSRTDDLLELVGEKIAESGFSEYISNGIAKK